MVPVAVCSRGLMAKRKTKKKAKTPKRPGKTHAKVKRTAEQIEATKKAAKLAKATKASPPTGYQPQGAGRPSVLTQKLINQVSQFIFAGCYIETACAACGLSKSLYYEWLKLGRNRRQLLENAMSETDAVKVNEMVTKINMIDPIYEQFSVAIEKAVVDAELRDLLRIDAAADKSWVAAAWKLERKYPERWGRKQEVRHSGEIDNPSSGAPSIEQTRSTILQLMRDPKSLDLAKQLVDRMDAIDVQHEDKS